MNLIAIFSPMKSGKSLELIARLAPYKYADEKVIFVQPERNVRDDYIQSRIGIQVAAQKVTKLADVPNDFTVIGIDEVHMFDVDDIAQIDTWISAGKVVIVSGLDIDSAQRLMPVAQALHELKPDLIIDKLAVCDSCKLYKARFTAILRDGNIIRSGLPSVVPDDGTYEYQALCRTCFTAS